MKTTRMKTTRLLLACMLSLSLPAVVLATRSVHAEVADARLVLKIEGTLPLGITEEQLRAAIAGELGVEVALAGPGVSGRGTILVKVSGTTATVSFSADGHTSAERPVTLPKSPTQGLDVLVVIVANLAQDEAGQLIAELKVHVAVAPSESASAATSASTVGEPTKAEAPPIAPPKITPTPEKKKPVVAPSACALSHAVLGADFLPGVGSSTTTDGRSAVRIASLNGIGGVAYGLAGFEVGGAFNVETGFACGLQIAGGANIVSGPVVGVQIGGGVNLGADLKGAQVSGGLNVADDLRGAQITGGLNLARDGHGLQISGGANLARNLYGVQIGSFNLAAFFGGAQIGVLNVAGSFDGAQVGVVNVAHGTASGLQLGVVNVADKSDVPIGLVNVVKNGVTSFEIVSTESGFTSFELVHGGTYLHNVFGFGVQPGNSTSSAMPSLTYGLGVRANQAPYTVDIELLVSSFLRKRATWEKTMEFFTVVPELRVLFGVPLAGGVSLVFGPSLRTLVSTDPETKPMGAWSGMQFHDGRRSTIYSTGTAVWLIPGITAGLRI